MGLRLRTGSLARPQHSRGWPILLRQACQGTGSGESNFTIGPPGPLVPIPKDFQVPPGCCKERWRGLEQGGAGDRRGICLRCEQPGTSLHLTLPPSSCRALVHLSTQPLRPAPPFLSAIAPAGREVFEGRSVLYGSSAAGPGTEWTFNTCVLTNGLMGSWNEPPGPPRPGCPPLCSAGCLLRTRLDSLRCPRPGSAHTLFPGR